MKCRALFFAAIAGLLVAMAWAQAGKPAGLLTSADLKTIVPSSFFYAGQSASVQLRNSAGIRTKENKYVLAGLVDTAGYASDVAQKYQGFLITEVKLKLGDSELAPGEYGFGFVNGKFVVTDVAADDVLSAPSTRDEQMKRPVPLKMVEEGGEYRLYAGRNYVSLHLD